MRGGKINCDCELLFVLQKRPDTRFGEYPVFSVCSLVMVIARFVGVIVGLHLVELMSAE